VDAISTFGAFARVQMSVAAAKEQREISIKTGEK
jgi:hypothetical protein